LDDQKRDTKDAIEKNLGRKTDYFVFIFYPERWMVEKAAKFKNEGVFILLKQGPNYQTNEDYERACRDKGSQLFLHHAEDMFAAVKKSIGR
jgi:hypothetical protein